MSKTSDIDSEKLEDELLANESTGVVSSSRLRTDDRVLARITDGIYRQPASALRELIANAYDADATQVHILTDAPRFNSITVRDNGQGLSRSALAHVIHHIGGSSKRTMKGAKLNVVDVDNPFLSPKGRRLIGKIGIGLFSVAQLTPHFQIISKVAGESFRRVADIVLTTHREDKLAEPGSNQEFETGSVKIWSVPANDIDSHGTDIVLLDLRQQARDILSSRERWQAMHSHSSEDEENPANLVPPLFHIGELDFGQPDVIYKGQHLPWEVSDSPKAKFQKLVTAVKAGERNGASNPEIEKILDSYLGMLWSLSLAAPLDYLDRNPFEIKNSDNIPVYELSNSPKGQAAEVILAPRQTIEQKLKLLSMKRGSQPQFDVFIDGVQLFRPISIVDSPTTSHAIKHPILFVGKCEPNLDRIPEEFRGGDLAFEAYFMWAPKIVPKEHNGIMLRINNASGTPFDETFLNYQVAEQTRLRQITAEIFVTKGLDAALNIDRESFNFSHPHYQYITKWVHGALRQLTNIQKRVARELRQDRLESEVQSLTVKINNAVTDEWQRVKSDPSEFPPEVMFADQKNTSGAKNSDSFIFSRSVVFAPSGAARKGATNGDPAFEERIKALTQILAAYGVLERLSVKKQEQLLGAIVKIFTVEA